jgi:glucose/arabinose dehydrogenase
MALRDQAAPVLLPRGLRLEMLSAGLEQPRMLSFAPDGSLYAGSRSGRVYRLPPPYEIPQEFAKLDDYPHSIAFRPGEVLIARSSGIWRAPWHDGQSTLDSSSLQQLAVLPADGGHDSRSLRTGPDGRLYVSLGISGNCSDEYLDASYPFERRRGGIFVLEEHAGDARLRPFASGLRNPVGFDWRAADGHLYASNNGPDHHGYEQPPEYFSRVLPGSFHGMPWFQFDGSHIRRDGCISRPPPRTDMHAPVATFPARNAPMAVAFVPPGALLGDLAHDAVVALRGSWGTQPDGGAGGDPASRRPPRLVVVRFNSDGQVTRVDDLLAGLQRADGSRLLRPVGLAFGPDGALYISSDGGELQGLFRLRPE